MVIQHNLQAMFTDRQLGITDKNKGKTSERLSSGYKINRAADDAAGLAISEKMRYQIRGLNQGADNIKEGIGYCQTADGALNEMTDMIHRLNELAIKAANGTNADSDRAAIDREVQALKTEMERICETTKYNEEYIFRGKEDRSDYKEVYDLKFSGFPDDLYIYNDSYDSATGTAVYGGIAYHGKRYAWSSISAAMYDSATGMFCEGTYSLRADDGTYLTLVCEKGSKPPQVLRQFTATASEAGISVDGEWISWDNVKTASGEAISSGNILNEPYYFLNHGVVTSFTPEPGEDMYDVISRLTGTKWESKYRVPTEKQALYANFSGNYVNFSSNDEVKDYLAGAGDFIPENKQYVVRAGDGTNGSHDGIWLELNGAEVAGSLRTWKEVGIENWGDQSRDIWADITYNFSFDPDKDNKADTDLSFSFQVINEISKDSVIDALDQVSLSELHSLRLENHGDLTVTVQDHVLSGTIKRDTINLTLGEEYGLGRDYTSIRDEFGKPAGLQFDGQQFSVGYTNTVDGTTTTKKYSNSQTQTDALVEEIKNKIMADTNQYLQVVAARYLAGADKPNEINLAALINPANITGGGGTTYFEDVVNFDPANPNLKSTQGMSGTTDFAGAKIDFSGLGRDYQLADLIGMGFNSTCQTCNNHYSIQFTTPSIVNGTWQSVSTDTGSYNYYYEQSGNNHTLYIDIQSMMGTVGNGTDFTNALVDIIDASRYDFHFSQYATYKNSAELYVFDNRPEYASGGVSTAKNASFSPYAYGFNSIAEFAIDLSDEDNLSQNMKIQYEYDYSDLFSIDNLDISYAPDPAGAYVLNPTTGDYEKYDPNNADHAGLTDRYSVGNIQLNTNGQTMDEYIADYVRNTMFQDVAGASQISLVSEYAKYGVSGRENENKAMVTEYNTPSQIKIRPKGSFVQTGLRIQCSSTANDYIYIPKQVLSLYGMQLMGIHVRTEEDARHAISVAGRALTKVNGIRSEFGAYQNRLEHSYDNVRNTAENTTAAESRIRDADMAKEMVAFSISNILAQAGESILAQANTRSQGILALVNG